MYALPLYFQSRQTNVTLGKNTSSQNDIFSVDMNTFRGEKDENCGVDFNLQIWWYIN